MRPVILITPDDAFEPEVYRPLFLVKRSYTTAVAGAGGLAVMPVKITTLVGAQEIDVILATKEQFEKYEDMDAFLPMDELLTEEQKEAYGDRVGEHSIRIEDSEKLDEFGLAPGEETYLAVFVYTEHIDYA